LYIIHTRGARAIKVVVVKYCAFLYLPVDCTKDKILSFSVQKYFQEGEKGKFDLTLIENNNREARSLYKKRATQEIRNKLLALRTTNGRGRKTRWEEKI
jgi:hypothetical protein